MPKSFTPAADRIKKNCIIPKGFEKEITNTKTDFQKTSLYESILKSNPYFIKEKTDNLIVTGHFIYYKNSVENTLSKEIKEVLNRVKSKNTFEIKIDSELKKFAEGIHKMSGLNEVLNFTISNNQMLINYENKNLGISSEFNQDTENTKNIKFSITTDKFNALLKNCGINDLISFDCCEGLICASVIKKGSLDFDWTVLISICKDSFEELVENKNEVLNSINHFYNPNSIERKFDLSGKDNLETILKTLKNQKSVMQFEFCQFWIGNKKNIHIEKENFDIINSYIEKNAVSIYEFWNKNFLKKENENVKIPEAKTNQNQIILRKSFELKVLEIPVENLPKNEVLDFNSFYKLLRVENFCQVNKITDIVEFLLCQNLKLNDLKEILKISKKLDQKVENMLNPVYWESWIKVWKNYYKETEKQEIKTEKPKTNTGGFYILVEYNELDGKKYNYFTSQKFESRESAKNFLTEARGSEKAMAIAIKIASQKEAEQKISQAKKEKNIINYKWEII